MPPIPTEQTPTRTDTPPAAPPQAEAGLVTVPNALSATRLLCSPLLIVFAWLDLRYACLGMFVFLLLTDWLDGKLAILLKQQSLFGTRLDSVADATFYACVLASAVWLDWEVVRAEWPWIGAAVVSYVASIIAGRIKFGRGPSYHTRLAKTSWLLMAVGFVAVFADWSVWPLRVAMAGVILTNLEAIAITLIATRPHFNVPSVFHVYRAERDLREAP
jgi:CDP-diacylglycerol--glycerol-3-phosphate 3-phosphatidyltransferase